MLKFFRKYNKWILGIGGSLLMIVFLIQPVMSMFQADPMKMSLATIDGGEITRGDRMNAESELQVLRQFGLFLDTDPDAASNNDDSLRWALILKDAEMLGLSASQREVEHLKIEVGRTDADIELIASRINATPAYIRQAMLHWLIVQQYKELLAGQTHLAGQDRARLFRGALNDPQGYRYYEAMAYGTTRMSQPLVEHFLQDQGAEVAGQVVLVPAEKFLDETPAPSDDQVQATFDQYKDSLPGESEPYGFGYRVPDRVKIEYLSIPMDQARQHVKISEADAIAHHREYPERFGGVAATDELPATDAKPYKQVRDDVIEDLTSQRAFELVEKMAKSAYVYFYEDTRGMEKEADYRIIEEVSALTSMRRVAEHLETDFGLLPTVHASDGSWVNVQDLITLPGIGLSRLADNFRVDLTSFILSAKELEPGSDNPLVPRRLQVGLAGSVMMGMDGSRFVFRLTDAQPTHLPESLDAVRDQVTEDTRLLNAYNKLTEDAGAWRTLAVEQGLEAVAERVNATVVTIPPTPRREPAANGLLAAPTIPAVGASEAFVESFFNTANNARSKGSVTDAADSDVTGIAGIDEKLALAVYRVDSYKPLTRQKYNEASSNPLLPVMIDGTILSQARAENPLSLKSLTARLNYVDLFDDEPTDDEEAAEAEVEADVKAEADTEAVEADAGS